jgi:short-subunit dehydrogenase
MSAAASPEEFRTRYGPWAVVAGAAVGLGAEYARQLAAVGLRLVLVDRDGPALAATTRELARQVEVLPVSLDLARPDVAPALTAALGAHEAGLLVYNAAVGIVSRFLDITAAQATTMLDVNCRAPMLLVHALAPAMVARGRGGIVLMSSMSGNFGSEQLAVYAATKAFDLVFADALWAELRPSGVDVLAVQPGATRTPGWQSSQPEALRGPGPHVAEAADVVREALATLGDGPNLVPGAQNRQGAEMLARMSRRQAVELMSGITGGLLPNR